MANWIDLGPTGDFATDPHQCLTVDGHPLVVLHHQGQYYVLENTCPHAGLPLGEGQCQGLVLTCPFHGYSYNIRTGQNVDFPDVEMPVGTYQTRVEDGRLWVDLQRANVEPAQ